MIAGTKAETVIAIIEKIPLKQRNLVTEITLDMAGNMGLIAKKSWIRNKTWGEVLEKKNIFVALTLRYENSRSFKIYAP